MAAAARSSRRRLSTRPPSTPPTTRCRPRPPIKYPWPLRRYVRYLCLPDLWPYPTLYPTHTHKRARARAIHQLSALLYEDVTNAEELRAGLLSGALPEFGTSHHLSMPIAARPTATLSFHDLFLPHTHTHTHTHASHAPSAGEPRGGGVVFPPAPGGQHGPPARAERGPSRQDAPRRAHLRARAQLQHLRGLPRLWRWPGRHQGACLPAFEPACLPACLCACVP
jgi:hypothetical protein